MSLCSAFFRTLAAAPCRVSMSSKNGRGVLIIRDVKEADQGAYTCEAINAKGLVFGIPDGVLTLTNKGGPGSLVGVVLLRPTNCVNLEDGSGSLAGVAQVA